MTRHDDDNPCRETRGGAELRRTTLKDWRNWVLGVLIAVATLTAGATISSCDSADEAGKAAAKAHDLAAKVRDLEADNKLANRATTYRLCSRNAVDRAFAHSAVRRAAGEKAMNSLQDYKVLAILNCAPNLDGRGAVPMTRKQQVNFVDRWERGQLTQEELGICPGDRIGKAGNQDC